MAKEKQNLLAQIQDNNTKINLIGQEITRLEHERSSVSKESDEKLFNTLQKGIDGFQKRIKELKADRAEMVEKL